MVELEQARGHAQPPDAPGLITRRHDIQVIFEQARQRRERRQLAGLVMASMLLAAATAIGLTIGGGGGKAAVHGGDSDRPATITKSKPAALTLPPVRIAWIDTDGYLYFGELATGAVHRGPAIDASTTSPPVSAGGQLYWSDANQNVAPIRAYDLATGKVRNLARGQAVFASLDSRRLYIIGNGSTLLELPADGSGRPAVLRVPAGWHLSAHGYQWFPWDGQVAGGMIVYSSNEPDRSPGSVKDGIWNPATGKVRILGQGQLIFAAYTPPGSRHSLIAWLAPSREFWQQYSFRITNTATLATVTVHSPLHHGFVFSGAPAFSPGGSRMAVFARTAALGSSNGMSRLTIVNTATGTVRVVPGTTLFTTEDAFWAMWLPGGQRILAGAVGSAYAVDARTLAARPFPFFYFPSADGFSATVLGRV
jgi:hypothetical protein